MKKCLRNRGIAEPIPDTNTDTKKIQQQDAVAFFEKKEKQQKDDSFYPCLNDIDIPQQEKAWITKRYHEDVVKNAIGWSTHADNPPTTTLVKSIKFACKQGLCVKDLAHPKLTVCQELNLHFKNGGYYNQAECFLNPQAIAFQRGMKQEQLGLEKFFCWKKFQEMCDSFGIPFQRNN